MFCNIFIPPPKKKFIKTCMREKQMNGLFSLMPTHMNMVHLFGPLVFNASSKCIIWNQATRCANIIHLVKVLPLTWEGTRWRGEPEERRCSYNELSALWFNWLHYLLHYREASITAAQRPLSKFGLWDLSKNIQTKYSPFRAALKIWNHLFFFPSRYLLRHSTNLMAWNFTTVTAQQWHNL